MAIPTTVGPDVHLHAEVPDVSLLAAGHLGVALVLLVLRRVRRLDEAGVNDPSRGQLQAGLEELLVDRLKDLRAELMLLEQMPELQDRGLIRRAVHQVQADELPRGGVLEQEVFHAGIAQVVRNLEQVDAKHQIQRERLAAPPSGRVVMFVKFLAVFLKIQDEPSKVAVELFTSFMV